jgi:hypothetical protein
MCKAQIAVVAFNNLDGVKAITFFSENYAKNAWKTTRFTIAVHLPGCKPHRCAREKVIERIKPWTFA